MAGKNQRHRCFISRVALHGDAAARVPDDFIADGKPQPLSLSIRFGCEEGFEDAVQVVGGNACAGIADGDHNRSALLSRFDGDSVAVVFRIIGFLPDRDGLPGVVQKIAENLNQTIPMTPYRRQVGLNAYNQPDGFQLQLVFKHSEACP